MQYLWANKTPHRRAVRGRISGDCKVRLGLLSNLNEAEGGLGDELAIEGKVNGVGAGLLELETLEVHDEVAGEEGSALGKSSLEVANDGHALGVESNTVLVNDGDAELVVTDVLGDEAQAESQSAGGVNNGELAGKQSVESTLNAELALIIGGIVAKYGNRRLNPQYITENPSR